MTASVDQPIDLSRRQVARITEAPLGRRAWPRTWPTRAGTGLLFMLAVLGFVAANPGLNLLLLLFGLGIGAILFNALLAGVQVRRIRVRRTLPDVAAVGRPSHIRYEIHNDSPRAAANSLWVIDGTGDGLDTPATWLEKVPPRTSVTGEVRIVPARRGMHTFDEVRLLSRFPFGLVRTVRTLRLPGRMLVWPALWRPRLDWLGRVQSSSQARSAQGSQRHAGIDEFYGIREYRPGDNVRWIHWRRSASLDRIVVREMADISPGRVSLVLETAGLADDPDGTVLDDLVSAAASLTCDALDRGWHVGLIANGQTAVVLPPAGGYTTRHRLLYELAILKAAGRRHLAELLADWPAGPRWGGRAMLLHPRTPDAESLATTAAGRLTQRIGPTRILWPDNLADWFDLSDARAGVPVLPADAAVAQFADASGSPGISRLPRQRQGGQA